MLLRIIVGLFLLIVTVPSATIPAIVLRSPSLIRKPEISAQIKQSVRVLALPLSQVMLQQIREVALLLINGSLPQPALAPGQMSEVAAVPSKICLSQVQEHLIRLLVLSQMYPIEGLRQWLAAALLAMIPVTV